MDTCTLGQVIRPFSEMAVAFMSSEQSMMRLLPWFKAAREELMDLFLLLFLLVLSSHPVAVYVFLMND